MRRTSALISITSCLTLAACGGGSQPPVAASPVVTVPSATAPATLGTGTPTIAVQPIPALLTKPGLQATTGGVYVDGNGYKERVAIKLYRPALLSASDEPGLDNMCPDPQQGLSAQVAKTNTTVDGAVAQAFEITYTSIVPNYPFPIDNYLTAYGAPVSPSLFYITDPSFRAEVACKIYEQDGTVKFIGFAALLPSAQSTPNNPDRKLTNCVDEVFLSDPLYTGTMSSYPSTPYGPAQSLSSGWTFPVLKAAFATRCI
jgi:hypothetical protein